MKAEELTDKFSKQNEILQKNSTNLMKELDKFKD